MCVTRVLAFPMELCRLNGIRLTDQSASSKPLIEVLSSQDRQLLSDRLPQPVLLEFPDRRLVQHDCGTYSINGRVYSPCLQVSR